LWVVKLRSRAPVVQQARAAGADGGVGCIIFYLGLLNFEYIVYSFDLWVEKWRSRARFVQQTRAAGADGGVDPINFYMSLVTFWCIV